MLINHDTEVREQLPVGDTGERTAPSSPLSDLSWAIVALWHCAPARSGAVRRPCADMPRRGLREVGQIMRAMTQVCASDVLIERSNAGRGRTARAHGQDEAKAGGEPLNCGRVRARPSAAQRRQRVVRDAAAVVGRADGHAVSHRELLRCKTSANANGEVSLGCGVSWRRRSCCSKRGQAR